MHFTLQICLHIQYLQSTFNYATLFNIKLDQLIYIIMYISKQLAVSIASFYGSYNFTESEMKLTVPLCQLTEVVVSSKNRNDSIL